MRAGKHVHIAVHAIHAKAPAKGHALTSKSAFSHPKFAVSRNRQRPIRRVGHGYFAGSY